MSSLALVHDKPPAPPLASMLRFPVADCVPSKTNPRKSFPADEIAELAGSIKRHDIIQPLLLRQHPTKHDVFEIVCGERRWRAAKEAGLVDVPGMVRALADNEVLEIQIVENLQRKDLTPLEEAEGYNVLLKAKYSLEQIAEKVGRSRQYVFDRSRLLKLVKGATELLRAGRIEVSHAIQLARLSPEDQVKTIREPRAVEGYNGHEMGLWARQRDLPGTSVNVSPRLNDDLKPVTARELAAWIQDHCRLKPEDEETGVLFPEVAAARELVAESVTAKFVKGAEKSVKTVEITTSHMIKDDVRDPKRRVLTVASWRRADGKAGSKECASSVIGIVVVGDGQGEAFRVCYDRKKCAVHFKAEIAAAEKREKEVSKAGKTGAERAELERKKDAIAAENTRRELARLKAALPVIHRALAEAVKKAPIARVTAFMDQQYGKANQGAERLLPAGKSVEGWLRTQALSGALIGIFDAANTGSWFIGEVRDAGKPWGVDVDKILKAQAAPIVAKCRVCGCTEDAPCSKRKTPTGPMEPCGWAEEPNKKTGAALCDFCAEKTGSKPAAATKPVAKGKGK